MTYTNSKLINYTKLSPNCNSRPYNQKITHIVPHYMAGDLTVESCGEVFAPTSRQASSNYAIGSDGRRAMYVEEKNRAWTTGSAAIDNKAVTIEVANYNANGNITDKAMKSLIELIADICKRNGIKKLDYTGDKRGNLHMHCWYQSTSCPGPYLKSKFPYIATQVNKALNASTNTLIETKCDGYFNKEAYNGAGHVGHIKKGEKVTHIEDDGYGWSKIKYNGKTGWCYNSHLVKPGLSAFHKGKLTANAGVYTKKGEKLATAKKGEKLKVYSFNNEGKAYCNYNSIKGWVKAEKIEVM